MFFFCFVQTAEYGADNLLLPARLWVLAEEGRVCANEFRTAPFSCEIGASIIECDVLRTISNCAVGTVAASSAFARAETIDWRARYCLGWFLYNFADATTNSAPERQIKSLKRRLRGNALFKVLHPMDALLYIEKFRNAGVSRVLAEAV